MPQKVRYRLVRVWPDGRRGTVLERAKRETLESWVGPYKRLYPKETFEIEEFVKEAKAQ